MSITLNKFLKNDGYCSVKLVFLETKHYLIEAKINGVCGRFILDTGASNSCVCTTLENNFNIISKETTEKASSATSEINNTKISKNNTIQIGKWENKIDSVSGIIGADVLKKSKAILDYNKNKLYIKL